MFVANQFGLPLLYIILVTSTSLFIVNQATRKSFRDRNTATYDRMDHLRSLQTESVGSIELLKYFCMEPYEITRYSKASHGLYRALWTQQVYQNARGLTLDLIRLSGKRICTFSLSMNLSAGPEILHCLSSDLKEVTLCDYMILLLPDHL
jgi:ABC-type bacteriocin/lantibiotic exporter with double-glycine peptidase domain